MVILTLYMYSIRKSAVPIKDREIMERASTLNELVMSE